MTTTEATQLVERHHGADREIEPAGQDGQGLGHGRERQCQPLIGGRLDHEEREPAGMDGEKDPEQDDEDEERQEDALITPEPEDEVGGQQAARGARQRPVDGELPVGHQPLPAPAAGMAPASGMAKAEPTMLLSVISGPTSSRTMPPR